MKGKGRLALLILLYIGYFAMAAMTAINLYMAIEQPIMIINALLSLFCFVGIYAYYHIGLAVLMMSDRMSLAATDADPRR